VVHASPRTRQASRRTAEGRPRRQPEMALTPLQPQSTATLAATATRRAACQQPQPARQRTVHMMICDLASGTFMQVLLSKCNLMQCASCEQFEEYFCLVDHVGGKDEHSPGFKENVGAAAGVGDEADDGEDAAEEAEDDPPSQAPPAAKRRAVISDSDDE
jgi:cytochrome c peroxidase